MPVPRLWQADFYVLHMGLSAQPKAEGICVGPREAFVNSLATVQSTPCPLARSHWCNSQWGEKSQKWVPWLRTFPRSNVLFHMRGAHGFQWQPACPGMQSLAIDRSCYRNEIINIWDQHWRNGVVDSISMKSASCWSWTCMQCAMTWKLWGCRYIEYRHGSLFLLL